MGKTYGYCRISRSTQKIERQIENISKAYPEAIIMQEAFTGTKIDRPVFNKLLAKLESGDTVVFDSVSRMSRDAEEGFKLYQELFNKGVDLVFLKEQHINTETYKKAMQNQIGMTGSAVDAILKGINEYLLLLAAEQIRIAFDQAEKEVTDLHERTAEGIREAKRKGKRIGTQTGDTWETKKAAAAKEIIRKHNKDFGGNLTNEETWTLAGISKMSFYKYKKELQQEQ